MIMNFLLKIDLLTAKNKRGWIKIVEVFAAILIISSIVLIAIQQSQGEEESIYSRVNSDQISILREIQLNDALRGEIITSSGVVEWADFPASSKNKIIEKTPNYMECTAKICAAGAECPPSGNQEGSVYAETVIMGATLDDYSLRQLRLFCVVKSE